MPINLNNSVTVFVVELIFDLKLLMKFKLLVCIYVFIFNVR